MQSKYSRDFAKELSLIAGPIELEKALQALIADLAESKADQVAKDRAGYIIVENLDRLPSVSQRAVLNNFTRTHPTPSRNLREKLRAAESGIKVKQDQELLETLSYETQEEQERIMMKVLADGLPRKYRNIISRINRRGVPSPEFRKFVLNMQVSLADCAMLLGENGSECAKEWFETRIKREKTEAIEGHAYLQRVGGGLMMTLDISRLIDQALEAGLEKTQVLDLFFKVYYPAMEGTEAIRRYFLSWAQRNNDTDLVHELCAIDPYLRREIKEMARRSVEKQYDGEWNRLAKFKDANSKGLSSPNNPFAEQLKGFKPK